MTDPYARIAKHISALLCQERSHNDLFAELAKLLLTALPADRFSLGTSVLNRWHVYENGEVDFSEYTR